ncbi:MAG: peptidase [Cyanobacteria bacterium RYN_339]|nr:peptidase [Cyanobacteria bacterium RYN_339]
MTRKTPPLLALALIAALAAPALAAPQLPTGSDPKVRVQDDLFRAVNGGWLNAAKIPGDKKAYGTFMILREQSNEHVKALLEEAAKKPGASKEAKLIGAYYTAMSNEKGLDAVGLMPLQDELAAIDAIKGVDDLAAVMARFNQLGVPVPVESGVWPDAKKPDTNTVYWGQGGLGLPDRDYYLKAGKQEETTRKAYKAYLAQLARLAWDPNPEATAAAAYNTELAIAKAEWSKVERRDAVKTYNPAPRATWDAKYPGFGWARFADGIGMPAKQDAVMAEPSYFAAFAKMAKATPLATWKAYLKLRLLDEFAPNLSKGFRDAHHGFKGEKLQGLSARPPRWRSAVEATNDALGEAIGAAYVQKHFPAANKARMKTLVDNLLVAYKDGLNKLTWMSPATRKAALEKLAKLRVKIGYPDTWRGYDGLLVKNNDAVGNLKRAAMFAYKRDMADAGKPVDKSRWDMTPQTVNAYYNPLGNEIVFPAAILQPPFFDANADDAYNYGAIGAVIGHEISHGFDDQGRRYDGTGTLRDWWTPADEKAFNARTERLAKQYSSYEPLPGLHVDGKLTMGENIADLTGVAMALNAYKVSLGGKAAKAINGTTAEQRFFIGYARVWRSKSRPEWLRQRVTADPHSPEMYRTNGVVTNVDAFYDAFGLKPGDKLYKKPEDRVKIW